jgi:hypothetical protein
MAIDKRVMKDIRLRRSLQELDAALKVSQAVSLQLMAVSGVAEGSIKPEVLQQTAVDTDALLKLASAIEAEESLIDSSVLPNTLKPRQV